MPFSAYSNTVQQPAAAPDRRTNVTSTVLSSTSAWVAFTAPADNGSAIASYRTQCISTDGGTSRTVDGTASPITVARLTPWKSYHCRVRATDAAGDSAYSPYSTSFRLPA